MEDSKDTTVTVRVALDTSEVDAAVEHIKAKLLELSKSLEKANSLQHELASGEINVNLRIGVDD